MDDKGKNDISADLRKAIKNIIDGVAKDRDFLIIRESLIQVEEAERSKRQELTDPKKIMSHYEKQVSQLEENRGIFEDISDVDKEIYNLHNRAVHEIKARIEAKIASGEIDDEELKELKKLYKLQADLRRKRQNHLVAKQKGKEASERMLQYTLGLSKEWEGISAKGFFKGFVQQIKKTITLSNILTSVGSGIVQQFFKLDEAQAQLFKQTGLSKDKVRLDGIARDMKGITTELFGKAKENVAAAFQSYKQFDSMTGLEVDTYGKASLIMTEMGASQAAIADILTYNVATLEKTPREGIKSLLRMKDLAKVTGRSVEETVREFAKSAPTLAMYGNKSEDIFEGLSYEAKRLNMEVSELLGLSLQMDSFEGAAKAAQNFNLAFGGPFISAQALMGASVEDKYKMIANAYQKSGAKLSRREISGLAKDAGLNEQKLLQILNREETSAVKKNIEAKSVDQQLQQGIADLKDNQSFQTRILANLEQLYINLGEKLGGNSTFFKMMETVANGLEFIADHFGKFLLAVVGYKAFMAFMSIKGTPAYPERVVDSSVGTAGTRGRKRRILGAVLGLGAAAVTGYATYKAMSPSGDESVEEKLKKAEEEKKKIKENKATTEISKALGQLEEAQSEKAGIAAVTSAVGATAAQQTGAQGRAQGFADPGMPGSMSQPTPTPSIPSMKAPSGDPMPGSQMPTTDSNDKVMEPGSFKVNMGNTSIRAKTVNSESNYVQPTFHKNDQYYNIIAAKPGGSIITALKTLEEAVEEMVSGLKNSDNKLSINTRELIRVIKKGLNEYA